MQPAREIIRKCGGAQRAAELAGCSVGWVYRWVTAEASGGTGGRIPDKPRRKLLDAAREGKIDLTPADFEAGWSQ